jgi:hypothetical protein
MNLRLNMKTQRTLKVNQQLINVINYRNADFINLTDMTSGFKAGSNLIGKWISNKNTLEYLSIWESLKKPQFNYTEFGVINQDAGSNRFIMSVGQWINKTNAAGLIVKGGRSGGTFAHKDIAFHFAMWLSPEFQIYLISEFQRLKDEESKLINQEWNIQNILTKINYRIQTDAIKETLIPNELTKEQIKAIYASEADLINVALFGMTHQQWKKRYPLKRGSLRNYATLTELIVLSNLESINAMLIRQELTQQVRLQQLNKVAISQIRSLLKSRSLESINKLQNP